MFLELGRGELRVVIMLYYQVARICTDHSHFTDVFCFHNQSPTLRENACTFFSHYHFYIVFVLKEAFKLNILLPSATFLMSWAFGF